MKAGASNVIVQGVLKGAFDVLDALLNESFSYGTVEVDDLAPGQLPGLLTEFPVCMHARIENAGLLLVAFRDDDALRLAAAVLGEESIETLDDAALETLKEAAGPFLGGGASNLSEKFQRDVELQEAQVHADGAASLQTLQEALGDAATVARFQFSASESFDAEAVLLFSQTLEEWVPQELINLVFGEDEAPTEDVTTLSEAEMGDILSSFDESAGAAAQQGARYPGNLDMILDIRLRVTARLGRVEMPIHEVLALGPGSIIEVGRTVDEPVELLVNDKLIARGDVVVVDEKFGLRITEIISARERIESLR